MGIETKMKKTSADRAHSDKEGGEEEDLKV